MDERRDMMKNLKDRMVDLDVVRCCIVCITVHFVKT